MVRIHHTQRFPMGTRVSKFFNGFADPFGGTVDQHSDMTDFYHISYDDGDSEEMTEDDVEKHLLSVPKPPRPPKASKPAKTLKSSKQPKAAKPSTLPVMKRASSDSSSDVSSSLPMVPSPTASEGKRRPKVLSLNANAPGLTRSNSFTGTSSTLQEARKLLSVSIPAEEEEEEEEVEMADEEDDDDDDDVSSTFSQEDVIKLIGKPVERTVTKEGSGIDVVQGAVASYFPATRMFRVMYFDGECSDLTYQQVFDSIPVDLRPAGPAKTKTRKRKADNLTTSKNGKASSVSSAPSAPSKRSKILELNAATSTKATVPTKQSPTASSLSSGARSPVNYTVSETNMAAVDDVEFNIVRKVLFIAVSTVKNSAVEMQLDVLSSVQLKDKEALEKFVRKNGLVSLADLLAKWETEVEAEQGVLLILKALAVLPGVTRDAIIDSKIGKKVRSIEKRGSFRDPAIPGLAAWVIQKMKADVGVRTEAQAKSKSTTGKSEGDKENRSRGSSSPRPSPSNSHRTDTKRDGRSAAASRARPQDTRPSKGKATVVSSGNGPDLKRSNSASHLLNLLKSRNGRDTSTARHDRDIFGNAQSKRRLGTANNWRARRSTVVLDQVSKRLTENAQEVEVLKTKKVEEDDWQPSKISFAEDKSTCLFDKEVEVSKLLVYRPVGSTKAPEHPTVKPRSGPLRSILRVRLPPPVVQEGAPRISEGNSAPPTVQSTARPAIDRIVVPSERPSLSIEVSEDGTADESPMFSTSKLSKVVSPTEKRKQGFSPPPCIPTSEQPPLDFTEKDEEIEDGKVSESDNNDGQLEPEPDAPKEASPSTPAEALSPVVSEDESSEEGEASLSDAEDSARKGDTVAPATCSIEPKDGGAASMESPVQQATTTSA